MVGELQWSIPQEVEMKVSCSTGHKGIMVVGGRAAVGYTYIYVCVDIPISQMQWLVEEIIITFWECWISDF